MLLSYSTIFLAVYIQSQVFNVAALIIPDHALENNTLYDEEKPSDSHLFARDDPVTFFHQYPANDEMKFISQPLGTDLDQLKDYVFLSPAGAGVTVYVHDSGINLRHNEFTTASKNLPKANVGWLYPSRPDLNVEPTTDPTGHGTCVADKVVGHKFGVAKKANLLMVPWIDLADFDWMKAGLRAIIDDIKAKRAKDPDFLAVVNFSYKFGNTVALRDKVEACRALYKEIYDLDVVMVFAAGNSGDYGKTELKHYPALFTKDFPNAIVVGSVDINGYPSKFTEGGPLVHISAPGATDSENGIECAQGTGRSATWRPEGTSIAAPTISGFAAYLLSIEPALRKQGSVAKNVKARILKLGYIRAVGALKGVPPMPAIWNGLEGAPAC
ncbi:hypothetical protein N7495_004832 [Penicillium taxi]|uniref:uncharacterized protein n=1 Tax=Penicillium taxi TaxID=168475 RepID=UPI0025451CED|nr:uncharacterized protein N7495_004832 [Penicillium taxi]KAJ5900088.1 hypothetical protein N7495_004832 [Penicillium taxi]